MFFDTHCHIDDEKFIEKYGENAVGKVIDNFETVGVKKVINAGCDVPSSETSRALSKAYNSVYFAAGIHPENADGFSLTQIDEIKEICSDNKCVAVGEIGLDYHYGKDNASAQKELFSLQLEMANERGLPVVVHSRDAASDTLEIVSQVKPKFGGVMHCYSGSVETAKRLLDLGFYFGFGGTLTFKNAVNLREVLKFLPKDRVLSETDSPYLSPEPKRGLINEPANIPIIVKKIAEIWETDLGFAEKIIEENALSLFPKLK